MNPSEESKSDPGPTSVLKSATSRSSPRSLVVVPSTKKHASVAFALPAESNEASSEGLGTPKEGAPSGQKEKTHSPSNPALDFYQQVVNGTAPPNGNPERSTVDASPKDYIPKLTLSDYRTSPPLSRLAAMSEADLAAVSHFSVARAGVGLVTWEGAVDVRGIDLDTTVAIEPQDISVYMLQEEKGTKPAVGSKLNRPAVITMMKTFPTKKGPKASSEVLEKFANAVKRKTEKMGAEFLSYNRSNGDWTFRVGHFSRYRLVLDDEDDEDEDVEMSTLQPESNFDVGERGGRSPPKTLAKKIGSPTRYAIKLNELDDDENYVEPENQTEQRDVAVVQDVDMIDLNTPDDLSNNAYAAMFLSSPAQPVEIPPGDDVKPVSEEDQRFPDDGAAASRIGLQPVLLAPENGISGGTSICSRIARKVGIKSSNHDHGFRMGRSFRVAWRPDGSFLQVGNGNCLVQRRPVFSADGSDTKCSSRLLTVHKEHSKKVDSLTPTKCPTFEFPQCGDEDGQARLLAAVEGLVGTPEAHTVLDDTSDDYLIKMAFALVVTLLKLRQSPTDALMLVDGSLNAGATSNQAQLMMNSFSQWVQGSCSIEMNRDVRAALGQSDIHKAIFIALAAGDIMKASSVASQNGHLQLATMIAAGSGCAGLLHKQVQIWHESGASKYFAPGLLRVYTLLSGNLSLEKRMFRQGDTAVDWLRWLGLLNKYGVDGATLQSFDQLVTTYDELVAAGDAPRPQSPSSAASLGAENLLYSLIRLGDSIIEGKTHAGVSIASVVKPSTHATSEHDLAAAFSLAAVLSALGCCSSLSELEESRLIQGYAAQLISGGRWELAVFVLLSRLGTASPEWRVSEAKRVVLQNFGNGMDTKEAYLRDVLGVPKDWLEEALAARCGIGGDVLGLISHLSKASPDQAREAAEDHLVPALLFRHDKDTAESLEVLKLLTTDANSLAGLVLQMYALSDDILELSDADQDRRKTDIPGLVVQVDNIQRELSRRKSAATNVLARQTQCPIPMASFLSEALSSLKLMKLQLQTLEAGGSIWDDLHRNKTDAAMKVASQLVSDLVGANGSPVAATPSIQGFY